MEADIVDVETMFDHRGCWKIQVLMIYMPVFFKYRKNTNLHCLKEDGILSNTSCELEECYL